MCRRRRHQANQSRWACLRCSQEGRRSRTRRQDAQCSSHRLPSGHQAPSQTAWPRPPMHEAFRPFAASNFAMDWCKKPPRGGTQDCHRRSAMQQRGGVCTLPRLVPSKNAALRVAGVLGSLEGRQKTRCEQLQNHSHLRQCAPALAAGLRFAGPGLRKYLFHTFKLQSRRERARTIHDKTRLRAQVREPPRRAIILHS